eukprot:357811-Chlamydomonas_euryale.AAC.3
MGEHMPVWACFHSHDGLHRESQAYAGSRNRSHQCWFTPDRYENSKKAATTASSPHLGLSLSALSKSTRCSQPRRTAELLPLGVWPQDRQGDQRLVPPRRVWCLERRCGRPPAHLTSPTASLRASLPPPCRFVRARRSTRAASDTALRSEDAEAVAPGARAWPSAGRGTAERGAHGMQGPSIERREDECEDDDDEVLCGELLRRLLAENTPRMTCGLW